MKTKYVHISAQIRRSIIDLGIPHSHSGVAKCVTVSLGVVSGLCIPANSIATMVRAADAQLYLAKDNGRNRVTSLLLSGDDGAKGAQRGS